MPPTRALVTVSAARRPGGPSDQDRYYLGEGQAGHGHAIVLDGASSPDPEPFDGGTYADFLGNALNARLLNDPTVDLRTAVAAAISDVVDRAHLAGGDLLPGRSPSSTVAAVRWTPDYIDALILGDTTVVVEQKGGGGIGIFRDDRLTFTATTERSAYRDHLRRGNGYGPEHDDRMRRVVQAERSHRNRPGGYWIAETDPRAAEHAIVERWPRDRFRAIMIATDGVARGIDQIGVPSSWAEAISIGRTGDLDTVLGMIEDAEASDPNGARWPRSKRHDDKTAVLVTFE